MPYYTVLRFIAATLDISSETAVWLHYPHNPSVPCNFCIKISSYEITHEQSTPKEAIWIFWNDNRVYRASWLLTNWIFTNSVHLILFQFTHSSSVPRVSALFLRHHQGIQCFDSHSTPLTNGSSHLESRNVPRNTVHCLCVGLVFEFRVIKLFEITWWSHFFLYVFMLRQSKESTDCQREAF